MANPNEDSLHTPNPNENSTYIYIYVCEILDIYIFVNRGLIKCM